MEKDSYSDEEIREILELKDIAVVGMSRNPSKAAHYVPKYLKENGYNIVPVNPSAQSILGLRCYKSLLDIPYSIDIVDIFRPSQDVPSIVKDAIRKGVKVVWMQEDIYSREGEESAKEYGIKVVWNRCMMKEHQRLLSQN